MKVDFILVGTSNLRMPVMNFVIDSIPMCSNSFDESFNDNVFFYDNELILRHRRHTTLCRNSAGVEPSPVFITRYFAAVSALLRYKSSGERCLLLLLLSRHCYGKILRRLQTYSHGRQSFLVLS